jgi:predicted MPP superfamily phosphohydrolase
MPVDTTLRKLNKSMSSIVQSEMLPEEILFLSDLHYDGTPLHVILAAVQAGISGRNIVAIVLCGDIAESLVQFREVVEAIRNEAGDIPILLTIGNHDLCTHREMGHPYSEQKYSEHYPQICDEFNVFYLDRGDTYKHKGVLILGNTGWYDLNARYNTNDIMPREYFQTCANKKKIGIIDHWIRWGRTDIEFSAQCAKKILDALTAAEKDDTVKDVIVATHTPLFYREIMNAIGDRNHDHRLDCYFYHPTLGNQLTCRFPKLRAVVSGHIHAFSKLVFERKGMKPLVNYTIQSDYEATGGLLIPVGDYHNFSFVSSKNGVLPGEDDLEPGYNEWWDSPHFCKDNVIHTYENDECTKCGKPLPF